MVKQDIDIKLEVHANQGESIGKAASNEFAWLIFIPPFAFGLISLALFTFSCFPFSFSLFKLIFFVLAIVSICIYARCAFKIHNINLDERTKNNKWYCYNQYWFNGLGAFVGWLALYLLLFYRVGIDSSYWHWLWFVKNIAWQDFVLGLVAFFGITGYFPFASSIGRFPGQ